MTAVSTDYQAHTATVTYDDSKTTVEAMTKALQKGDYSVVGKPVFLK